MHKRKVTRKISYNRSFFIFLSNMNSESSILRLSEMLVERSILKFGTFKLKSGLTSWFYVDLRLIPSYPSLFQYIISCYKELLKEIPDDIDGLAGVAVAGIPFSSVLGYELSLPALIVRPQPKEHGLKKQVEGIAEKGSNIVIIDDLITTGGSKIPSITALEEEGYTVRHLVVLIDRSEGELKELKEKGIKIHSYATINQIFEACLKLSDNILSIEQKDLIRKNWKN